MKKAEIIHDSVVREAWSLKRSSMKGKATNIAPLSRSSRTIDDEQTKRTTQALLAIGSVSSEWFRSLKLFKSTQVGGSGLLGHLPQELDTNPVEVGPAHRAMAP